MDITKVTAPTEKEVKESFNRINVFFWVSHHFTYSFSLGNT